MVPLKADSQKNAANTRQLALSQIFVYLTGIILVLIGVCLLALLRDMDRVTVPLDPIFKLSAGKMCILFTILHLAVSAYIFIGRDTLNKEALITWVGLVHVCYLAGLIWVQARRPYPLVQYAAWSLDWHTSTIRDLWLVLTAHLLFGGVICLFFEWLRFRQLEAASFMERWSKLREQTGTRAALKEKEPGRAPLSSQSPPVIGITKREDVPVNIKFACPKCGQRIKCESSFSGNQINCPACQQQLTIPRIP